MSAQHAETRDGRDENGRTALDRLRVYLERLDGADAALWAGDIWTDDLWPYDEESGDLIGVTMVDDIRTLVAQFDGDGRTAP